MSASKAFKKRPITAAVQAVCYSMLLNSTAHAAPAGGAVVGGTGTINQSGANTTINQTTQNMAINWQSYNVNANEHVQYNQPNASSVSLNSILSNDGSTIAGRIDANGRVILVNPNGIFFTPTASINVGSLIASTLSINPADFMNGTYIFNEITGTNGQVINSGIINASLGGNVALIGKQVENKGLIVAKLGTVTLAAGKQAVLTFDNEGLLGVRVSKEILQSELGVDPAVLNSGTIQAQGGKVLLTASVSQDIFSQAVNTNGIQQATSVVVNKDGSFTLGSGADVVNTGTIDTSTISPSQSVGRIVLIGNNVTSSGALKADAKDGNAGEIELHAKDTTLLTQNSLTSARSETNGNGGIVKVLGDKVGLVDQSKVDVSGANGGGQALIGGDLHGANKGIRNASATIIRSGASIYADALQAGNGGKVVVWADGNTYFGGTIYGRGGYLKGDGGFAETSGHERLIFRGFANLSTPNGEVGTLLLDPKNITVSAGSTTTAVGGTAVDFQSFGSVPFADVTYNNVDLANQLTFTNVSLLANNNITFSADVTRAETGGSALNRNLTLLAGKSIFINSNIALDGGNFAAIVNTKQVYDAGQSANRDSGQAVFNMGAGSSIVTRGGNITIDSGVFAAANTYASPAPSLTPYLGDFTLRNLDTSAVSGSGNNAGAISVTNSTGNINVIESSTGAGVITNGSIKAIGGSANGNGGNGGAVNLEATDGNISIANSSIVTDGGNGDINNSRGGAAGNAGTITITVGKQLDLSATLQANAGSYGSTGSAGSASAIVIQGGAGANTFNINTGAVFSGASVTINGNGGNDTFNLNTLFTGTVNGLAGSVDTVVGPSPTTATNAWLVDRANGGSLNQSGTGALTGIVTFRNVANIKTGNGTNNVTVNSAGSVSGTITTGTDTNTVNINGTVASVDGATNNGTNNINVNAGGTVTGAITGGSGVDTFVVAGTVNGLIDGGAGVDSLTINGTNNPTVQLGNIVNPLANLTVYRVENITGSTTATNTLIGSDATTNTWTIGVAGTGANQVNDGTTTTTFSNFANLTGGRARDDFTVNTSIASIGTGDGVNSVLVNAGGTVAGAIVGGAGVDTITVNGSAGSIAAGAGNDIITIASPAAITSTATNAIDGGADIDSLTVNSAGTTWTLNSSTSGTIANAGTSRSFVNIEGFVNNGGGSATLDYSTVAGPITVYLGQIGGFTNILGNYNGTTNVNSTLTGTNSPLTTWTINGTNSGEVIWTGQATPVGFSAFNNLTGGTGADTFNFTTHPISGTTGSITGLVMGGAGPGVNTLSGLNSANYWNMTAANTGNVNAGAIDTATNYASFQQIQILRGGDANDIFAFTALPAIGTVAINGDGTGIQTGTDTINLASLTGALTVQLGNTGFSNIESLVGNNTTTITGDNVDTTWTVNGAHAGSVGTLNFTGISALNGGTGDDTFNFSVTPTVAAINISGGSQGVNGDHANFSSVAAGQPINIVIDGPAGVGAPVFTGIEKYTGNNTDSTLTATNATNLWVIGQITGNTDVGNNGVNDGTVNGIAFVNFNNITGGNGDDTFQFKPTATITGALNGGAFVNYNLIDYSLFPSVSLDTGNLNITGAGTFTNVNGVVGNNTASTISASAANVWNILNVAGTDTRGQNGSNDGTVGGVTFINFNNLTGNNGDDNFIIASTGSVTGLINGALGNNTLTGRDGANYWTANALTGTSTLQVTNAQGAQYAAFANIQNLVGGNANDTFIVNGSLTSIDTRSGTNSVSVAAGGNVANILGGVGDDTFLVSGIVGSINAGDGANTVTVNSGGSVTNAISGGTGIDTISIGGTAGSIAAGAGNNNITVNVGGIVTNSISSLANDDTIIVNGTAGSINAGDGNNAVTIGTGAYVAGGVVVGGGNDTVIVAGNTSSVTLGGGTNSATVNVGGNVTGAITGGTGVDTITVNGSAGSIFADTGDDILSLGGTVSGLIDGGVGNDQLTITGTVDRSVQLGGVIASNPANPDYSVANIESITVQNSGTVNSRLIGANVANTWTINGENSGTVSDGTTTTAFTGFANLRGGTRNDTFRLNNGSINGTTYTGSLRGLLEGGGGTDSVTINYVPSGTQPPTYLIDIVDPAPTTQINNPPNTYTLSIYRGGTITGTNITLLSNAENVWNITGVDTGTLVTAGGSTSFTSSNLIGGSKSDTFNWQAGGSISGLIDGRGGNNSLIITDTGDKTILLGGIANTTGLPVNQVMSVNNVQTITGNGAFTNTIVGANSANAWTIAPVTITSYNYLVSPATLVSRTDYVANSGTITNNNFTTTFANFQNINGGTAADTFRLAGNGSLSGVIRGGGGVDSLTIDSTVGRAMNVQLLGAVPALQIVDPINTLAVYQIGTVNGNSPADVLVGANVTNAWDITGSNSGKVTFGANTTNFTNFANLTGGTAIDTFNIVRVTATQQNGSVSGVIHTGLGGADVLNVNLSGSETGQASMIVDAGATATVNIQNAVGGNAGAYTAGNVGSYSGIYTPALAGFDRLAYTSGASTFTVQYSGTPTNTTVNDTVTANGLTINGTNANDTIALGASTFGLSGAIPVHYAGVNSVTVNGQAGIDTINLNNVNLAGSLTLTAESVTGNSLTANTLTLDNVGQFGSAAAQINTTIDTLQLVNAGPVYINESNGLNLNTSGTVTNDGIFTIAGITNIDAGGGSLTLSNAANNFHTLNVSNASAINVTDVDRIDGGTITADSITLNTATGVGALGGFLNTNTAHLTVNNSTSGGVYVSNNGAALVGITNVGDIGLNNNGNLTIDRLYTDGADFVTRDQYHDVTLNVTNGTVQGMMQHSIYAAPDITAHNLDVIVQGGGGFGTQVRPISLSVVNRFSYIGGRGFVYYFGGQQPTFIATAADLVSFSALDILTSLQLLEIESLGEFDPAIFTEVRNYYYEDVAIMMPSDQRLDSTDEAETEEERQGKADEAKP